MLAGHGLTLVKFTRDGYLLYRKSSSSRHEAFLKALNSSGFSYETIRSNDSEHILKIVNREVLKYRKDPIKFKMSYYGNDIRPILDSLKLNVPDNFPTTSDPEIFSIAYAWSELDHILSDLQFTFDRLNDPFISQYVTRVVEMLDKLRPTILSNLDSGSVDSFYSDINSVLTLANESILDTLMRIKSDIDHKLHASLYEDLIPYMNLLPETWAYVRPMLLRVWSAFAEKSLILLNKWASSTKLSGVFLQDPSPISDEMLDFMYDMAPDDNVVMSILKKSESSGIRPYVSEIKDDRVFMKLDMWPGQYKRGYGYEYYTFMVSDCPIIIIDSHYLISSDKGVLYTLSEGDLMPKIAKDNGSCSLMRVTFTMNAVLDPLFLDYLRSIGSTQFTKNTWDIPYQLEAEVDEILGHIKNEFGYPIQIFQILDGYEITGNAEECEARVRTALVNIKINGGTPPKRASNLMNRIAEKLSTAGKMSNNSGLNNISKTMRVGYWYCVAPKSDVIGCSCDCDCDDNPATQYVEMPPTNIEKIWIPDDGMVEVVDVNDDSCTCVDSQNEFKTVEFNSFEPSDGWFEDDLILVTT